MTTSPSASGCTCLLFVDDDADFRNAMAFSFIRKGYRVLTAANGKDAFDLIQANEVHAVISDIRMPGGDGIELLARTRQSNLSVPIVLLVTGFSDLTIEEAHDKGAEALFSKPFDKKELENAILRLLTPPETRWAGRANAGLTVELQHQSLSKAIAAKVINIGRGGMFVGLEEGRCPEINDELNFKLTFEETPNFVGGTGIVRWVRTKETPSFPTGCGIEFTYMGDAEKRIILSMVEAEKPMAFIPKH